MTRELATCWRIPASDHNVRIQEPEFEARQSIEPQRLLNGSGVDRPLRGVERGARIEFRLR